MPVRPRELVGDERDLAVADGVKTPLNGSSLAGSSKPSGSPNGGSVKYSVPSER